jgi:hypothetical protein
MRPFGARVQKQHRLVNGAFFTLRGEFGHRPLRPQASDEQQYGAAAGNHQGNSIDQQRHRKTSAKQYSGIGPDTNLNDSGSLRL